MTQKVDLMKIGVLLLGISAVIIAGVVLYMTYKVINEESHEREAFWAYCNDNYIIVNANKEIFNVKVIDIDTNKTVCTFDHIGKGSSDACRIDIPANKTKIFKVIADGYSKVVTCYNYEYGVVRTLK